MATETITSVTVVGQYGCLAFHGPGRERVLIPEPPIIRKVNGENLPKPSEEAERAYQILYLNKLPPLPLKSTPTFIINQGNRNDRFQYTVNGGERNIAGTGLPQQHVENPPPAAYREQPSTSRQQQQHHSLHVTGNDNIANNDGRSGSGLDHCKDLKARSQEIDEQIIAQAQSFANADLRDLETISILQQQIKDLIKIKEGLNLSSSSKTPEGVSNLLDHNVGAAHGCFNGNVLDKRDKDTIGRSNSEESIPKEIPQGGQVFNGEQLGAPMGGFEREFPQFEGRERMEKPNWHANRAAMAANNLECVDASNDLEWQRQDFPWSEEANKVNREVFGNTAFRYHQLSIINATMKGHDVFVLMPTGGGKSLCYQLPSVLPHGHNKLKKLTVVISPLISLIQDQVFHLEQLGLHAISLGAGGSDLYRIRETVEAGDLQVVFLTPEKLMQSNYVQSTIRKLAEQDLLARIVIDEAHCVSQWGHDFRPDYTQLSIFKELCPRVPILALTATATPRVQKDIVLQLGLTNCVMFRSSFNRPNLSYKVQFGGKSQDAKIKEIAQMISDRHSIPLGNSRTAKCGIIYCTAKLTAENVAEKLNSELDTILGPSRSRRVKPYHAGFTKEEREAIQQDWTAGNVPIVVATIAFGMGINKPDVRFVVHFNMPKSLEGYLQESGRAGRDGQPAECVIYYNWNDVIKLKKMLQDEEKREEAIERGATSEQFDIQQAHSLESLHAMAAFCQEPHRCRREMMLEYFNEKFERSECKNTCDNCQKLDGLQLKYVDQTESAKTVIQILEYLAKKQEASKSNEASLGTVRSIFYGDKEVEGKYDSSIIGIGKVFKFPKKEMERLIRTMITEGIIKEDVHRSSAGFLNSYFRVDGTKASHVMSGRLKVQLTEAEPSGTGRVLTSKKKRNAQNPPEPPKTTNARSDVRKSPLKRHRIGVDGAPASGAMKCLPVICHGNSLPPVHNRALPQQMVSRQEIRSGPDPWTETRHQVMTVMLRQLSTELKRIYKLQSIPINTKVQAELASNPPTSLDSLHALQINNLSKTMKQRYGLAIIAGVTQADHYVQQMKSSSNNNIGSAADFQLDTSQIFSEVRENTSLVGHDSASHPSSSWALEKDGWSDDDNNQWQTHHLPNFSRFEYTNANQRPVTTEHGLNNQSRSLQNNASSMATVEMQRQQLWKAKLTHGVERAFAQRSPPPARPAQATADCHVNTLTDDIDWL